MNNVSKAIIIAGGFLITMLIISISMYLLTSFREIYDTSMTEFETQQIAAFNSFFTQYGSKIKGYDVYNIIGKINEVNADEDTSYFIRFTNSSITREGTFYFTENLSKDYSYSYTFDSEGVINTVTVSEIAS